MFTSNPAWREAYEWETPGQLEPQLMKLGEPLKHKTHLIDLDTGTSFCGKAVVGDKAITLEQAQDPENGMFFNCEECYNKVQPE